MIAEANVVRSAGAESAGAGQMAGVATQALPPGLPGIVQSKAPRNAAMAPSALAAGLKGLIGLAKSYVDNGQKVPTHLENAIAQAMQPPMMVTLPSKGP